MFRNKLLHRVLFIISINMIAGFAALGALSLWMEYRATMKLQIKNNRSMNAFLVSQMTELMMKGEASEAARYAKEAREKQHVLDLRIFNAKGNEYGTASGTGSADVARSLSLGKTLESAGRLRGEHVLTTTLPLLNEPRCQGCHDKSLKYVGAISLTTSLEEGYASAKMLTLLLTVTGFGFFFAMLASIGVFFRKTIMRDILGFADNVRSLAHMEGDLRREIPVNSSDEIGQLAKDLNHLTAKLRDIMTALSQQAEDIAISVCKVTKGTTETFEAAVEQKEQAVSVAVGAEEMAATLTSVASSTQRAATLSFQVSRAADSGMAAVGETFQCMEAISQSVVGTLGTVQRLESSSNKIGEIVTLIEDIADQTNLLALNAAIEAARAGEHGRGFAVVADEVKNLSAKTAASTREITQIIKKIQAESREAAMSISSEKERVEEGVVKSTAARDCLDNILKMVQESTDMFNQIASATEEQSATTTEISAKIHHVSETATSVHRQLDTNAAIFGKLSEVAENIFSTVGKFSVGNRHDAIKAYACELRDRAVAEIENAIASRRIALEDLFDRNHQPIPNTLPQKYSTRFDKFFEMAVSTIQEDIAKRDSDIFYAICVDDRGYCPCHNLRYSRPLTGNPEVDKANNRTKRIFDDRTGLRAARNTEPFLLQTYMRDTGEIMNDLSTPVFVGNRHWGAIRIGYKSTQ